MSIYKTLLVLCMCTWLGVCWYVCMHVEDRGQCWVSPVLFFSDKVCHRTQTGSIWLDWLDSKFQGSSLTLSSLCWDYNVHHSIWLFFFKGILKIWTWSSCLHNKHFTEWSIFAVLCLFLRHTTFTLLLSLFNNSFVLSFPKWKRHTY